MYIYEDAVTPLNIRYVAYYNNEETPFSVIIYKDTKNLRIYGFLGDYYFIKLNEESILKFFNLIKELIYSEYLPISSEYTIPRDTYGNRIFLDWINGDLYKSYRI